MPRWIVKLNGCELNHQMAGLAIDILGELGLLYDGSDHLRDGGFWQARYVLDLGLIIGGGTAQIQKNIIGERALGLPKDRKWRRADPGPTLSRPKGAPSPGFVERMALVGTGDRKGRPISGYLESGCPLTRVRETAEARDDRAEDVWNELTNLGVHGVLIDEDYGGVGLGHLEAALIAEALGAVVAPVPYVASSIMAPTALAAAGSDEQKEA